MAQLYRRQQKNKLSSTLSEIVDARDIISNSYGTFAIVDMVDSTFDYLPKVHQRLTLYDVELLIIVDLQQYLLLNSIDQQYAELYRRSILLIKEHVLYRPMTK